MQSSMQPAVDRFAHILAQATYAEREMINELTDLAKLLHSSSAQRLTELLSRHILAVGGQREGHSTRRLTYMYIIDSILKNVQGSFVPLFE